MLGERNPHHDRGDGQTIILQDLLHGVGQIGGRRASPRLFSADGEHEELEDRFFKLVLVKPSSNTRAEKGVRLLNDRRAEPVLHLLLSVRGEQH